MPFDKPGTLTPQQSYDVATYIKISQQPTALEATGEPRLAEVAAALRSAASRYSAYRR